MMILKVSLYSIVSIVFQWTSTNHGLRLRIMESNREQQTQLLLDPLLVASDKDAPGFLLQVRWWLCMVSCNHLRDVSRNLHDFFAVVTTCAFHRWVCAFKLVSSESFVNSIPPYGLSPWCCLQCKTLICSSERWCKWYIAKVVPEVGIVGPARSIGDFPLESWLIHMRRCVTHCPCFTTIMGRWRLVTWWIDKRKGKKKVSELFVKGHVLELQNGCPI